MAISVCQQKNGTPQRETHLSCSGLQQVSIFVDIGLDDSYTPQKISIRAGTFHGDLHEVRYCSFEHFQYLLTSEQVRHVELENPRGWVHLALGSLAENEGNNADEIDYTDPEMFVYHAKLSS